LSFSENPAGVVEEARLPLLPLSQVREAEKKFRKRFGWWLLLIILMFAIGALALAEATHREMWPALGYIPLVGIKIWVTIRIVNSLSRRFGLLCPYCGDSIAQPKMGRKIHLRGVTGTARGAEGK
jgi:hypothetical protein